MSEPLFPKLPLKLVEHAPADRMLWTKGLDHGLDVALRLDLDDLQHRVSTLSSGAAARTVRLSLAESTRARLDLLTRRSGWSQRRAITVGLHLALSDRYSPIYAPDYVVGRAA